MKPGVFRSALIAGGVCALAISAFAGPKWTVGSGYWTNGATWNGNSVPASNDDVVIMAGHTVSNASKTVIEVNSLIVTGVLTHASNNAADSYNVSVRAASFVTVVGSGKVDVSGRGYAGGNPAQTNGYGPAGGIAQNVRSGGGGYGGEGGAGGNTYDLANEASIYGSVTNPVDLGSGGGASYSYPTYQGGAGGGAVKVEAPTVTVDGSILADGLDGMSGWDSWYAAGGGAGGSIWIITTNLAGAGTIRARGGCGGAFASDKHGGGGGGGRIALFYVTNSFSGVCRAPGGSNVPTLGGGGGAGTIYQRALPNGSATLVIDNCVTNMNRIAGTWVSNDLFSTLSSLVIRNYGVLKHATNGPGVTNTLSIIAPGMTLTVGTNGFIDVSNRGYPGYGTTNGGGPGGGQAYNQSGQGGGYGGTGGAGGGTPIGGPGGVTYGSSNQPTALGSAGGAGTTYSIAGGSGGGAIYLQVASLSLDGWIKANGETVSDDPNTSRGGGGSGGSVWIAVSRFSGRGGIAANGGTPSSGWWGYAGGGGGGRIAVYVLQAPFYTSGSFAGTYQVNGGTRVGASNPGNPGTIYLKLYPRGTVVSAW